MTNACKKFCKLFDDMDMFGKEPELYFKGNTKRTSWLGKIFTFIYILIYAAFFIYKLYRMIKNKDVDFYQTTTFTGQTPSIHLTNEMFYGGFALGNPSTLKTFVDESIYYAEAYFISGHKEGNDWIFIPKPLEVEVYKLEKFGKGYRDIFETKIENLYCLKDMNVTLEGHTTYDVYSYFQIYFYPCVNTTENNNKCKSPEIIQSMLGLSLVTVKIQDVELTPENYNSPIELRGKELSSPAYLNLYQNIQAYFHIVHIETDTDYIGFELLKNIETKTYFKYDDTFILPSINNIDILNTPHQAYCHVTIQLSEQILTIKRTNTKLTVVLGDIGGLMEVVFSLLNILSSFFTEVLYEQALINNLFSFDIDKKIIKIKETKKNANISRKEEIKIYDKSDKISPQITQKNLYINDNDVINTKNKLNDGITNKNNTNNDTLLVSRNLKYTGIKKKVKSKKTFSSINTKLNSNEVKIKLSFVNENENNNNGNGKNLYTNNFNISNSNEANENEKEKNKDLEERKIVNKIKINKCSIFFCFLCVRKFNNLPNILLDEGMILIMEKLDIRYLLKKIFKNDIIQENYDFKNMELKMSDESKERIQKIYDSLFGL